MIYYIIIGISMLIIMAVNAIFNTFMLPLWYIAVAVVALTVAVIAIDGLFAFIVRHLLPAKLFDIDKKCFQVGKKEIAWYDKLAIRRWKDKVLELGQFTGFKKNAVQSDIDSAYFARFMLECNYGIVVHIACIIVGFAVCFIYPLQYWYMFGLPIAIVNAVLNYLPICILRYNVPRLRTMYTMYQRREAKAQLQVDSTVAQS